MPFNISDPRMVTTPQADALVRLYDDVDRRIEALYRLHGPRLNCRRGCAACCVDDITVFEVEAANIRRRHARLLAIERPGPEGVCAFLAPDRACRIYASRPYVCRTQGPPLRWMDELEDGTPVEMRDICPLNATGPPIEALPQEACWSIGPVEAALAGLQTRIDDGALRRIALRALFENTDHR